MTTDAIRVTRLARYPVKACAPELLDQADVRVEGLRNDRVLAVVVDGQVATQRELPLLARVRPVLDDASGRLSLSLAGAGREPVEDLVRTNGQPALVTLFGDPVRVVAQAERFSVWLTELLGCPARLVAAPETTRRTSPGEVEGMTVLSDEASVSLHSEASLDRLNETLARRDHPPLPADRFRANIVVAGCAAHAEDDARWFAVGDAALRYAGPDPRCVVTTVDQAAGRRAGPEPLRSLAGYRRLPDGGVGFGVYLAVDRPGVVRVGDPVTLTSGS